MKQRIGEPELVHPNPAIPRPPHPELRGDSFARRRASVVFNQRSSAGPHPLPLVPCRAAAPAEAADAGATVVRSAAETRVRSRPDGALVGDRAVEVPAAAPLACFCLRPRATANLSTDGAGQTEHRRTPAHRTAPATAAPPGLARGGGARSSWRRGRRLISDLERNSASEVRSRWPEMHLRMNLIPSTKFSEFICEKLCAGHHQHNLRCGHLRQSGHLPFEPSRGAHTAIKHIAHMPPWPQGPTLPTGTALQQMKHCSLLLVSGAGRKQIPRS
jgi:hypothetical protein